MRTDRTKANRFYNRRLRRLSENCASALLAKERRESRREEFEATYAPLYRDYGRKVEDADRARAIREADMARFIGGADVHIVDGRIVLSTER